MKKAEKFLIGSVATGLAALVFALAQNPSPSHVAAVPVSAEVAAAPVTSATPSSVTQSAAPVQADPIPPLPANATSIPDGYLKKLSMLVGLPDAAAHAPDKAHWSQAIPIAQKLSDGPCDCAQKVWLKRFVEMGNYALTNSADQYNKAAKYIITLGLNDQQAMELSHNRSRAN